MVKSITYLASIIATVATVTAFERSSPLLAWSSHDLTSISLLSRSTAPSNIFSTPSPAQITLSSEHEHDLCSLSSILLISVPGLHASDLSLLPSASSSPNGLRASLASAVSRVEELYLSATEIKRAAKPRSIAKHFVRDCQAVVERAGLANFWEGTQGKSIKFDRVDGMEDIELTGTVARVQRKELMLTVDQVIAQHLSTLSAPYLVILTALPAPTGEHHNVVKRDLISTIEAEIFGASTLKQTARNATNIFRPDPSSGLFHRYVFFTPALIFCLLLTILVLIPVVVIAIQALTAIETVQGLEGKMTGTVGPEKS